MKKVDLKIKNLCDKLQYIVKYGNEIVVNKRYVSWANDMYTVSSNGLCDDIFTIAFIISKDAYSIKVNDKDSEDLSILVDKNNENVKNLMELVIDKYENQKDKEKIEKIDQSLGIIDRISDKIFKED